MTTQKKSENTNLRNQAKGKLAIKIVPIAIAALGFLSWAGWRGLTAPVEAKGKKFDQSKQVQFRVESGATGNQIGLELANSGLIKSNNGWKAWTKIKQLKDSSGGFKAGKYLVSPEESLSDIASKIWAGEIMQTDFTVPEGWSTKQMAKYFESQGYFDAEEFESAVQQIPYDKYPWLPQDLPILEGFLYPDTYKVSSDLTSDPQAIINTMLNRFEKFALPVYEAKKPEMSL